MPIYRKDGSVFKLRGPNPLMEDQEEWTDTENIVVHNFDKISDKEVVDKQIVPLQSGFDAIKDDQSNLDDRPPLETILRPKTVVFEVPTLPPLPVVDLGDPDEITIEKEEPDPEPEPPVIDPDPDPDRPLSFYRSLRRYELHCLPAEMQDNYDSLYDEKRIRVSYRNPFRFVAAVVSQEDLRFVIWTTVKQVTTNSILFQPQHRRWWKATQIEVDQSGDGFVITCMPSELKPDFTHEP